MIAIIQIDRILDKCLSLTFWYGLVPYWEFSLWPYTTLDSWAIYVGTCHWVIYLLWPEPCFDCISKLWKKICLMCWVPSWIGLDSTRLDWCWQCCAYISYWVGFVPISWPQDGERLLYLCGVLMHILELLTILSLPWNLITLEFDSSRNFLSHCGLCDGPFKGCADCHVCFCLLKTASSHC